MFESYRFSNEGFEMCHKYYILLDKVLHIQTFLKQSIALRERERCIIHIHVYTCTYYEHPYSLRKMSSSLKLF